ncbi:S41 family peptidase [Chryseobacterium sp. JK1]|uniref:S41 family peptidase n=1 Tax=Chryseobacterium sp. JK1 TaxID=874294 RepID=UPI003D699071
MNTKKLWQFFLLAVLLLFGNLSFAQNQYQKDFQEFWSDINEHYAYLDQQHINWKEVKKIYEPQTEKISSREEFIHFLEKVLNELYNGHSSLNTNLNTSNRLVPSGSDLYIEKNGTQYFIKDLRKGFGSDLAGLQIGMEVTKFNGKPIDPQLKQFSPKFTNKYNQKMQQYAIDMLFAGTHNEKREITAVINGKEKTFSPVTYGNSDQLLYSKVMNPQTAYIKINNSLGNNQLIAEFDKTLDGFLLYKNLIIDLTETPGGGNSTVARAIMGRFTDKQLPYQTHEFTEKEYQTLRHWTEYVSPRKEIFKGNLYILVSHWTGSMGEGIAIGFDGMNRATVIGTQMAGLLGAISSFQMSETKIGFQFPAERLYHINGTPREDYIPAILTQNMEDTFQKAREIQ